MHNFEKPKNISWPRKLETTELMFAFCRPGRVVRNPINFNPELKINQKINFPCTKISFIAYVLCSLRFPKLEPEGQTI